jgi:hypothetical protein
MPRVTGPRLCGPTERATLTKRSEVNVAYERAIRQRTGATGAEPASADRAPGESTGASYDVTVRFER